MKSILSVAVFTGWNLYGVAQKGWPVPSANSNMLFYLQRTPDSNTVVYELNIKNDVLDSLHPVHVFWIRYSENRQREELSPIQRKYAYGIKAVKLSHNHYTLSLVSYKKYQMLLESGPDNKLRVFVIINKTRAILSNMYLQINGGSFWSPNIEFVEFSGINPANGAIIKERIKLEK